MEMNVQIKKTAAQSNAGQFIELIKKELETKKTGRI